MLFIKIILFVFWMFIIPTGIGLLFTNFIKDEKNNIVLAFVIGHLFDFAICELLSVPMIMIGLSFKTLVVTYIVISIILLIISLYKNKSDFKEIFSTSLNYIKKLPKLLTILLIALVALQVLALVKYAHIDDDDAFYVGTATTTIYTNSMFKYDGSTGKEYTEIPERYAIGPFPIYTALISDLINIHPAIVAHTILPIVFIPLVYLIYALIAKDLLKSERSVIIFLVLLCILYIWGNFSKRTNFTFLLFRIWQGKAVLANIILPAMWLFFIKAIKNNFKLVNCILLIMVILAGILTTTMGIGLPAITLMSLAFVFAIKDKKISYLVKSSICCLPCVIYFAIYIILHYNIISL